MKMSLANRQLTGESAGLPKAAVAVLLAVLAFGIFMVGFDQGEILGIAVPPDGTGGEPGTNWPHEFYHDMRHAAGMPCH